MILLQILSVKVYINRHLFFLLCFLQNLSVLLIILFLSRFLWRFNIRNFLMLALFSVSQLLLNQSSMGFGLFFLINLLLDLLLLFTDSMFNLIFVCYIFHTFLNRNLLLYHFFRECLLYISRLVAFLNSVLFGYIHPMDHVYHREHKQKEIHHY
jgi:hypothetical protein